MLTRLQGDGEYRVFGSDRLGAKQRVEAPADKPDLDLNTGKNSSVGSKMLI